MAEKVFVEMLHGEIFGAAEYEAPARRRFLHQPQRISVNGLGGFEEQRPGEIHPHHLVRPGGLGIRHAQIAPRRRGEGFDHRQRGARQVLDQRAVRAVVVRDGDLAGGAQHGQHLA